MSAKINIPELAVDLGIILFSSVLAQFYDSLVSLKILSVPFPVVFLLLSLYFLPVFLGNLYNNVFPPGDKKFRRAVIFTLVGNLLFIFGNIMYYTIHKEILPELTGMSVGVMAMVLLLMGPIAGFMFTTKQAAPDKVSTQITISIITCGLLFLFVLLICGGEWFRNIWGLFQFFMIIGFIVGDVILIMLAMGAMYALRHFLIRTKLYDPLNRALLFSIPFLAAFLLTVFNLHASRIIFSSAGAGTISSKILLSGAFVFSGVLPLRIILAVKPPYYIVNILIGVLSIGMLLFSIFR